MAKKNVKKEAKKGASFYIGLSAVAFIAHVIVLIICFLLAILYLKGRVLSNNIIYLTIAASAPFIVWVLSTTQDYWNFHNR